MPNLDDVLNETMLAYAHAGLMSMLEMCGPLNERSLPFPIKQPDPGPLPSSTVEVWKEAWKRKGLNILKNLIHVDVAIALAPIWSYDSPAINGKVRVNNVWARVRGMNYMPMKVCDYVEWGPVSFLGKDFGGRVDLPLTQSYLLRSYFQPFGCIPDEDVRQAGAIPASKYWKLPTFTDQSFELVFGYEFPAFANSAQPAPIKDETLITFPNLQNHGCVTDPGSTARFTLRVPPKRIIIVVSFVTCKENNDFAPMGALGAGKIHPHIYAISNFDIETLSGKVTVARPAKVTMHCDAMPNDDKASVEMQGEKMSSDIGSVLFTDTNVSRTMLPDPCWSNIFDYYDTDPKPGKYVMVRRIAESPAHTVMKGSAPATVRSYELVQVLAPDGHCVPQYVQRPILKTAGQGEFDNIHLAPKMMIDPTDVDAPSYMKCLTGFDRIVMAPFCIHDCLHMHVRWGTINTDQWTLGWRGEDEAYAVGGAPMVPSNQQITINLQSPTVFDYIAEAKKVRAGKWQIIYSHGLGYALVTRWKGELGRILAPRPVSAKGDQGKWAILYWNLRYSAISGQNERLSFTADDLMSYREGGAGASLPAAAGQ